MRAIVLTSDLTVSSFVVGAAARARCHVDVAMSAPALLEKASQGGLGLVVVDLETSGLDIATLVSQLRQWLGKGARIVAFGPHVHEWRLQSARDAGCDDVMSRGEFHATAESLFREPAV